jgi:hypothetical protein
VVGCLETRTRVHGQMQWLTKLKSHTNSRWEVIGIIAIIHSTIHLYRIIEVGKLLVLCTGNLYRFLHRIKLHVHCHQASQRQSFTTTKVAPFDTTTIQPFLTHFLPFFFPRRPQNSGNALQRKKLPTPKRFELLLPKEIDF